MRLLLVEGHDAPTGAPMQIDFGMVCDVIKLKFFVGVGDTFYFKADGVTDELNVNKYSISSPFTSIKIDNALGTVPCNMYEVCFTRLNAVSFYCTSGLSNVLIEYLRY